MVEFIIPWVQMRARDEYIRKSARSYPVLEPFAPRHSISYFNNNKKDSARSAYERLHKVDGFDPAKARCDRTKPSLYWTEIYLENQALKVPLISSHWHGRPNREQFDFLEKKYNRSGKLQEYNVRSGVTYITDEDDREICSN